LKMFWKSSKLLSPLHLLSSSLDYLSFFWAWCIMEFRELSDFEWVSLGLFLLLGLGLVDLELMIGWS